jgi:hypothetical protein
LACSVSGETLVEETLTEDPLQAARRLYVDSITHHPEVTKLARRSLGPHRVVSGGDWPFLMGSSAGLEGRGERSRT